MSEPTKKTLQDLYAWSDRLADDWLGLGERLRRYADAWKADVEVLRGEVERLTQERSTVARNPYADQNRALVAEIAARRGITLGRLREDGGCELAQIMRRLDKAECMGEVAPSERLANLPKRAYYETHDPPHCPTCECGR